MGIWIRSQNGIALCHANEIWVEGEEVYVNSLKLYIGKYEREGEAARALDMIQKYIGDVEYGRYGGNVIYPIFEMPPAGFSAKPEKFYPDCGADLNHCGLLDETAPLERSCYEFNKCKAAWDRGCRQMAEKRDYDQDWLTTCLVANLSGTEMKWRHMLRYWMFEYSESKKSYLYLQAENAALRKEIDDCYKAVEKNDNEGIAQLMRDVPLYLTIEEIFGDLKEADAEVERLQRLEKAARLVYNKECKPCIERKCNICALCAFGIVKDALAGLEG